MNRKVHLSAKLFLVFTFVFTTYNCYSQENTRIYNFRKLARRSDKERGYKYPVDNPTARAFHDNMMFSNPLTGEIPANMYEREMLFVNSAISELQQSYLKSGIEAVEWTNRGPYNVGGRTRALAIDPRNENILLAGGVSGGMWRSTNGGQFWTKTTGASEVHSVTAIAQDPNSKDVWYYSTGELIGNSASSGTAPYLGNGIYKSINNGVSWTLLNSTASNSPETFNFFDYSFNIIVNPDNSDVYVASYGVIMRSQDGGTSWETVLGSSNNWEFLYSDIACTSTGVLYATLSSKNPLKKGIFTSSNGTSWTNITPSNFPSSYNRILIGEAPSNESIVYFFGETPGGGYYNSVDEEWISLWKYNGTSWTNLSDNLPNYGGEVGNMHTQGSYNILIEVKPDNENVVFIGGTNLYRSNDGFSSRNSTTWIGGYSPSNDIAFYAFQHPDQHSLVFYPSNSKHMLVGHDGGISKTTDNTGDAPGYNPVYWTYLNNGYLTTQSYTLSIKEDVEFDNSVMVGFQDNGTWFTDKNEADSAWLEEYSGDGSYCAFADSPEGTYRYVSSQYGNIYRFNYDKNDNYLNFTRVTPAGVNLDEVLFISPFVLDPNDDKTMYFGGSDMVWYNSNLQEIPLSSNDATNVNWSEIYVSTVKDNELISALGISKIPANCLYLGTNAGTISRIDNANTDWAKKTDISSNKGLPTNVFVSCIYVDPSDEKKVLVVFSNYEVPSVFSSIDGGNSWTDVSGNLEENPDGTGNGPSVRSITKSYAGLGKDRYFVGTSTGLYSTEELNGASTVWKQEGTDIIGNVVIQMVKGRSDGMIFAATHGNGVYSSRYPVFENLLTECINQSTMPSNWNTITINNTGSIGLPQISVVSATSNPAGYSATTCSHFIEFNSSSCDAGDQAQLSVNTSFSTVGFTANTVEFDWLVSHSSTNADSITVQYSFDGDNWFNAYSYLRYDADSTWWKSISCLLPDSTEDRDSLYIAFLFSSANGNNCYLDNIIVKGKMQADPPVITSVETNKTGEVILLNFDKYMSNYQYVLNEFALKTEEQIEIEKIALSDTNKLIVEISLSSPIFIGEDAYISYTKGSVLANDRGKLRTFVLEKIQSKMEITEENENTVSIIPNPTNGEFTYYYLSETNGEVKVNLYNLNGKLIYSEVQQKVTGQLKSTIRLMHLNRGVYTLGIVNGKKRASTKVIIMY